MLRVNLALILASSVISMAQVAGVPPNQNSGGGANGNGGNGGNGSGSSRSTQLPLSDSFRTAYVTGRVLMSDGSSPSQSIVVQRVCGVTVTAQTHTDSKGRFSLQLSGDRALLPDASSGSVVRNDPAGCELRASTQGYRSDSLTLNSRHPTDDSNVGTIILHRVVKGEGLTISATTGFAPKAVRKSYENGLAAIHRNNPDEAQRDFLLAVSAYPKFAAAWFELGRVYERRSHAAEARHAYTQAVAADANYVNPYERLYMLDAKEGRWQQAADTSEKVMRLDPLEFPRAYYINAVANTQLRHLADAERSAREALKLQGVDAEPRAQYILGVILMSKGDLAAAKAALLAFLQSGPDGPDERRAKQILSQIEARMMPRPAPPSA
jgi:tetratricopeptide (TPR) repeat protein